MDIIKSLEISCYKMCRLTLRGYIRTESIDEIFLRSLKGFFLEMFYRCILFWNRRVNSLFVDLFSYDLQRQEHDNEILNNALIILFLMLILLKSA